MIFDTLVDTVGCFGVFSRAKNFKTYGLIHVCSGELCRRQGFYIIFRIHGLFRNRISNSFRDCKLYLQRRR